MKDFRTSILVDKQLPQFITEDYPKFVSFIEAYYEFLENEQFDGSVSQKNDLTSKLKTLRYIPDIDKSLDQFEDQFYNVYASLVPRDTSVSKDFLLKNIYPLYNSKGSEQSFKLLFRMLYGEDIILSTPKDNILRASDGRWTVDNILRVNQEVITFFIGDGENKEFNLAQEVSEDVILVAINGITQTGNFFIKREAKKLIFDVAPLDGDEITIEYMFFDVSLLVNREVIGSTSGAKAIIEKISSRVFGEGTCLQIYFNEKTINGSFINGEPIHTTFLNEKDVLFNVRLFSLSYILDIQITNPGASYNVGDPALVVGSSTRQARIVVDDVESGVIENVDITYGGAGFKVFNNVNAKDVDATSFQGQVISVDESGLISPNSITFISDIIEDYANVIISASDYGFPAVGAENLTSTLEDALTFSVVSNIGPATLIEVNTSLISTSPELYINPPFVGDVVVDEIGAIGRIYIVNGGLGYSVGDYLIFTNQPGDFEGRGANAEVTLVDDFGTITRVTIHNGGYSYRNNQFPYITVSSAGTGANLTVRCLMGEGEELVGVLPVDEFGNIKYAGMIKSFKILDQGQGYNIIPNIDLTGFGNKLATAVPIMSPSTEKAQGRWVSSKGLLSNEDMKIQGLDYYVDFTYLISSKIEFSKFKDALINLIHPSGMKAFSEYMFNHEATIISENIIDKLEHEAYIGIAGLVNTNSSVYLVGTNTNFTLSETNGILVPGSVIIVNNEVQVVNTIISSNTLTVVNAFSFTSNSQTLTIRA